MKIKQTLAAATILLALPGQAQVLETFSFSPNLTIPDGNATGVSDTRTIATPATSISSLNVTLDITGEFNGDLYVYLRHDSGFSVLLNRPGRDSGSLFGYSDSGFDITLSGSAANDIHTYRNQSTPGPGLQLNGIWQADGRDVDPTTVLAADPRTATLTSFQGLDPNGQWTLFAADLANGGSSQISSWGLQVTTVPEPGMFTLAAGSGLVAFSVYRRFRRS